MICPRCHSAHILVQPVTRYRTKHRGCFAWFGWILLAILTCGLILLIPLLTNTTVRSKTRTEAFCQACGKRWRV